MKSKDCSETYKAFTLMISDIRENIRALNKETALDQINELERRLWKVIMQDANEDYQS